MAKHLNPTSGLLGMESDLHRVPRLLEGIGAIALTGLEASNGIDRADCETIYEIVACAVESAKRSFKAWQGALERPKGSSEDVEDVSIQGRAAEFTRIGDEGGRCTYSFCPACGATVYYRIDTQPGLIAIPAGAFADLSFPPPSLSFYHGTRRCQWVEIRAKPLQTFD
jgi:hypothetical protein